MPPARDPIAVLTQARGLIAAPGSWTQGCFARNKDGHSGLAPNDPNAVCYCGLGAVMCVASYDTPQIVHDTLNELAARRLGERDTILPAGRNAFVFFNDHPDTTHDEVLAVFDEAIATLTPKDTPS